ncbi:MAG TPA: hypothetical protein VFG69_14925, partial [Nannocystaceae bacterium]|nr:hypothetical protein [Nannocystaceae bacterium]
YLLPPCAREPADATRGDPMRRASEPTVFDRTCPHCGEHGWIDLGVVPIAMRARDEEMDAARVARTRRSAAVVSTAVTGMVAMVAATAVPWSTRWGAVPMLALATIAIGIAMLAARVRSRARRWHRPASRWRTGARIARGRATAPTSVAPLSGRRGIAWVVAVRYAGDDPRRHVRLTNDSDWALVEQHCGALEIDGKRFEDGMVVDMDVVELAVPSDGAHEWLRTRGLDPMDDLQLFEGVLTGDETVEVYANTAGPVPICRPIERAPMAHGPRKSMYDRPRGFLR